MRRVRSMDFQVRNLSEDWDWRFATCPTFGILALRRVRFHGYSLPYEKANKKSANLDGGMHTMRPHNY